MDAILPLPWTVYLNIHFLPTPHHLLLLLQLLKTSPLSMEKFHSMDRKYKLSEEYQEHTCLYILTYSVSKADISLFSKTTFALWSGLFVILWSWESIFLIPFAFKVSSTYFLSIAMLFYFYSFPFIHYETILPPSQTDNIFESLLSLFIQVTLLPLILTFSHSLFLLLKPIQYHLYCFWSSYNLN